jgi:hypothetical protein
MMLSELLGYMNDYLNLIRLAKSRIKQMDACKYDYVNYDD